MMSGSPVNDRREASQTAGSSAGHAPARLNHFVCSNCTANLAANRSTRARSQSNSAPQHRAGFSRRPISGVWRRAKDAMRRTKAALVFLRSPSSHQQRKETCKWIMQSPIRQPRLSSAVHWS